MTSIHHNAMAAEHHPANAAQTVTSYPDAPCYRVDAKGNIVAWTGLCSQLGNQYLSRAIQRTIEQRQPCRDSDKAPPVTDWQLFASNPDLWLAAAAVAGGVMLLSA